MKGRARRSWKMPITLNNVEARVRKAVRHYWKTLGEQAGRQGADGRVDAGNRTAVTGGKQMDGFCDLLMGVLADNGITQAVIHRHSQLEIPGYFRPTKKWDMLIFHGPVLLAVIEFKSQRGPSFGNNLNNRAEEAVGTANDVLIAYRERAFGDQAPKPWLGWLMLLEDCDASQRPVGVAEPHFKVFPEFKGSSYAKRYEIMLRKLRLENLFNETALILSKETNAATGAYSEPAHDLSMQRFLASFSAHIAAVIVS